MTVGDWHRLEKRRPKVKKAGKTSGRTATADDAKAFSDAVRKAVNEIPIGERGIDFFDAIFTVEVALLERIMETSKSKAHAARRLAINRTAFVEKLRRYCKSNVTSDS